MNDSLKHCRIFLESFGCSSNIADGEFMSGCLIEAGFELVDSTRDAEILIYNTCAVKSPTENRAVEVLKKARQMKGKKILVTGCLPLINFRRLREEVDFDAVLGPNCASSVVETVQKIIHNKPTPPLEPRRSETSSLLLPKRAVNSVVSVVPVAQGCLGSCAYCCVVLARGRLHSCSISDVVERVKADLVSGAREVWLTGQDIGAYGKDIGVNLAELLGNVCTLDGDFMVRVGMMTPNSVRDMLSNMLEAFQNEHVFKFIHLPVQSGNDQVLERMNRLYRVDDFKGIVEAFRDAFPQITLATDVICGFPGETPEAFGQTLQLIEEIKPDVVNISKFFPRPETVASRMKQEVTPPEVNERSRRITTLAKQISLEKNKTWLGWEGKILIDEHGKQPHTFISRNFAYKPIVIKSENSSLLGNFVKAKITKAFQTYLEAEVVD